MKHTEVNHKLSYLQTSNPLLPPDPDTARTLEIIPVHNHVHKQVECYRHPRDRGKSDELCVAEQGGSSMMIGVQEGSKKSANYLQCWGNTAH